MSGRGQDNVEAVIRRIMALCEPGDRRGEQSLRRQLEQSRNEGWSEEQIVVGFEELYEDAMEEFESRNSLSCGGPPGGRGFGTGRHAADRSGEGRHGGGHHGGGRSGGGGRDPRSRGGPDTRDSGRRDFDGVDFDDDEDGDWRQVDPDFLFDGSRGGSREGARHGGGHGGDRRRR